MIFVDTGAWFAMHVPADPHYAVARAWYDQRQDTLATTDYVIDETVTLLRARRLGNLAVTVGERLWSGEMADVHYTTRADLIEAWRIFRSYHDKAWSFTDCTSFAVTQRLGIATAFAFDEHFRQFGHLTIVPQVP